LASDVPRARSGSAAAEGLAVVEQAGTTAENPPTAATAPTAPPARRTSRRDQERSGPTTPGILSAPRCGSVPPTGG